MVWQYEKTLNAAIHATRNLAVTLKTSVHSAMICEFANAVPKMFLIEKEKC